MKKMIAGMTLFLLVMLVFAALSLAAGDALYIDTEYVCDGMAKSYAEGYVPSVSGGNADFVLPLRSRDTSVNSITVTPIIGTAEDSPFSYGNYEFSVSADADGLFLIRLSLPLKANRVNGTYAVTFKARYTDSDGKAQTQEFPVYLTITDGKDPDAAEEKTVSGALFIDSATLYTGMNKTYAQGYMPTVQDGKAYLLLPLLGDTYDGRVSVTLDLGTTTDSPFVYGNYSQTRSAWNSAFLFSFEIPLEKSRYNGSYPIVANAAYLDANGNASVQSFTVYITITDGATPPDPNAVAKEEAEKPELFISNCTIDPQTVGGDSAFTVTLTIENIGNIRARSVKLTYGSEETGILPADANNAMLLDNIAAGESVSAAFKLKTTKDVLAGNRSFSVTLDYVDLYSGTYTATRQFLVNVTQPVELSYDSISVAKSVTAGDTFTLPANVFNVGKATLRNVTVTVTGAGLFPTSSVFLGDILPGEAGYGELKVFVGMLSMTEGYTESYGQTYGQYVITYYDDADQEYTISIDFTTEINAPVIEASTDSTEDQKPVIQWWVAVLVGFAVIAILVTALVLAKFTREIKMK